MPSAPSARTKLLIAVLIALTSVLGAVAAWRASVASGAAAAAEDDGIGDRQAAEQMRSQITAVQDSIVFDYLQRVRSRTESEALREELRGQGGSLAAALRAEAEAHELFADVAVVDPDAVGPDGSLQLQTKLDREWTFARQDQDLDPSEEFAEADRFILKSERLVGITALLVGAALFLTLAQVSRTRGHVLYLGAGVVVLGAASTLLLIVELL